MAALATLPNTTFAQDVGVNDSTVALTSVADVTVGLFLVSGAESMKVIGFGPLSGMVTVLRGRSGTASRPHASTDVVWIGRGDQFYEQDPTGAPQSGPAVAPWINTLNGNVWWPLNNTTDTSGRWQITTVSYTTGPLGVATVTFNPSVTGTYTTS